MKKLAFNSIKTRFAFWFLIIALTPLLVALIVTYKQRVNVIETRTFDKLTAIRDLKVERLQDWLKERAGDLNTASTDNELTFLESIISKDNLSPTDLINLENIRRILNR